MMSQVHDPNLPPANAAPPRKGWFSRNWLWFVPTVVLLPICLCGGLCVGVPYFAMRGLAESGAYKIALETVQQNAAVKEALGEPVEGKLIPIGAEIDASGGAKEAKIGFQVQGPKGAAIVASSSRKEAGSDQWVLTELIVTPTTGDKPITIVSRSGSGGEPIGIDGESGAEAEMPAEDLPTQESQTESPEIETPAAEQPPAEAPAEEPAAEPASEEKPE